MANEEIPRGDPSIFLLIIRFLRKCGSRSPEKGRGRKEEEGEKDGGRAREGDEFEGRSSLEG